MKTSVTIETITVPAHQTFQRCYCGAAKRGQSCDECGFVASDEQINYEVGTVWERVETSKHGSATFSYDAEDSEMRDRRLLAALRRAVGHTVSIGWGHYGYAPKTGGLNPEGTYTTRRI